MKSKQVLLGTMLACTCFNFSLTTSGQVLLGRSKLSIKNHPTVQSIFEFQVQIFNYMSTSIGQKTCEIWLYKHAFVCVELQLFPHQLSNNFRIQMGKNI